MRSMEQQRRKRKYRWGRKGTILRDECFVYFAKASVGDVDFIKIGFTAVDVQKRVKVLQLGCPVPLQLIGWVRATRQMEVDLHSKFEHLRSHREWFRLDAELSDEMSRLLLDRDS